VCRSPSPSRSPRLQEENGAVTGDAASRSSRIAQKQFVWRRRLQVTAGGIIAGADAHPCLGLDLRVRNASLRELLKHVAH